MDLVVRVGLIKILSLRLVNPANSHVISALQLQRIVLDVIRLLTIHFTIMKEIVIVPVQAQPTNKAMNVWPVV